MIDLSQIDAREQTQGLVYEVTDWQRLLYEARRDRSHALGRAVRRTREAVPVEDTREARAWADLVGDSFAGEVFARLYNGPEKLEKPDGPRWAPAAHEILDSMEEFSALCANVGGDADLAAIASGRMLDMISERLPQLAEEEERREQEQEPGEPGSGDAGGGDGAAAGEPSERDVMRAMLAEVCEAAEDEARQIREGLAGLAPGLEAAPPARQEQDPRRMELAERLGQDRDLADVLRRAGRIQRISQRTKKVRSADARSEVVSIERGADLARVLPSQLAGLRHPLLRRLTLRNIVERQCIQYALDGTEQLGRGPITLLLDRSGSMVGSPNTWACAISIAILRTARKERRAMTVVGFNGGICSVHRMDERGRCEMIRVDRRGTHVGIEQIELADLALFLATAKPSGGTNFERPFRYAMDGFGADERADLVFVTDGHAAAPEDLLERIRAAREERGLRVYGLTVARGAVTAPMQALCDEVVDLSQADRADAGAAVVIPA